MTAPLGTAIAGDSTPPTEPLPWSEATRRLAAGDTYWLATGTVDGGAQIRPVLAVRVEGRLHTTSNPTARKATHLATGRRCSISVRVDSVDVVLEGRPTRVTDPDHLQRVADAYQSKYGWPATVADDGFDAPYGAPTAGPPPYAVYAISPEVVYAFGTDEELAPRSTRWRP